MLNPSNYFDPQLEYFNRFWVLHFSMNVKFMARTENKFSRMLPRIYHFSYMNWQRSHCRMLNLEIPSGSDSIWRRKTTFSNPGWWTSMKFGQFWYQLKRLFVSLINNVVMLNDNNSCYMWIVWTCLWSRIMPPIHNITP